MALGTGVRGELGRATTRCSLVAADGAFCVLQPMLQRKTMVALPLSNLAPGQHTDKTRDGRKRTATVYFVNVCVCVYIIYI